MPYHLATPQGALVPTPFAQHPQHLRHTGSASVVKITSVHAKPLWRSELAPEFACRRSANRLEPAPDALYKAPNQCPVWLGWQGQQTRTTYRSIAQPGSAPRSGRGGRVFESPYSDQFEPGAFEPPVFCCARSCAIPIRRASGCSQTMRSSQSGQSR